jgi:hypothetical protein
VDFSDIPLGSHEDLPRYKLLAEASALLQSKLCIMQVMPLSMASISDLTIDSRHAHVVPEIINIKQIRTAKSSLLLAAMQLFVGQALNDCRCRNHRDVFEIGCMGCRDLKFVEDSNWRRRK